MPTNIDNRVVQMTFDNQQFERGVKESLLTLEQLKKGLDLDKSAASLSNLEKAAANFDISGIAKGVDSIANRFTLLGNIGQEIFRRISRTAVNAMEGVVNTITSMPKAGMAKYETKNKAVQMIQSALPDKSIEEVEAVLARLNEYTDLTSYDFSTMVHTIGKFTSVGVDLELAERAMEGIGNEAGSAGAEISQANIAMYNFAQAMGAGSMKLTDWKSINLAGMATKEFKEQIIETAYELGRLQKVDEYVGQTAKGVTVDFKSFDQTLRYGWMDTEVMLAVLNKYADTTTEVGRKGFLASKMAITFTQAIDAIKDALSTGWMKSLEYLFGNLEEAGKLFTDISDAIIDFTAQFSEARNEILKGWHEGVNDVSGYKLAIEALSNIWEVFTNVVEACQIAIEGVFGTFTAEDLIAITQGVRDVTAQLRAMFGMEVELQTVKSGQRMAHNYKAVAADLEEDTKKVSAFTEAIQRGMRTDSVKEMQKNLLALGDDTIRLDRFGVDGIFGPETQAAVKAFQKSVGLAETGIYDLETRNALASKLNPEETYWDTLETRIVKVAPGLQNIEKIVHGILSVVRVGVNIVKIGMGVVGGVIKMISPVAMGLLSIAGGLGDVVTYFMSFADALTSADGWLAIFNAVLGPVSENLANVGSFLSFVGEGLTNIIEVASQASSFENLGELLRLDEIKNAAGIMIYDFLVNVRDVLSQIEPYIEKVKNWVITKPIQGINNFVSAFRSAGVAISKRGGLDGAIASFEKHGVDGLTYKILLAMRTIRGTFNKATAFARGFFGKIGSFFTNLWNQIKEGKIFQKVLTGIVTVFQALLMIVGGVGLGLFEFGKAVYNGVKWVINLVKNSELLSSIFEKLKTFLSPVVGFFNRLGDTVRTVFSKITEGKKFEEIWASISETLSKNTIGTKLVSAFNKLRGVIGKPLKLVRSFGEALRLAFTAIKNRGGLDAAIASFEKYGATGSPTFKILEFMQKARDFLLGFKPIIDKVRNTVGSFFGAIGPAFKMVGGSVWDSIRKFFAYDESKSFGENMASKFEDIKKALQEKWDGIVTWFDGFVASSPFLTAVVSKFGEIKDSVVEFAKATGDAVSNFFGMFEQDWEDPTEGMPHNYIPTEMYESSSPLEKLKSRLKAFDPVIELFRTNVSKQFEEVKTTLKEKWDGIVTWFEGIVSESPFLEAVISKLSEVKDGVIEFVKTIKDSFVNFFKSFGNEWDDPTEGMAHNFVPTEMFEPSGPLERFKSKLAAFDPVIDWFREKIEAIKEFLTGSEGLVTKIKELFSGNGLFGVIGKIFTSITGGFSGMLSQQGIGSVISKITNVVGTSAWLILAKAISRFSKSFGMITKSRTNLVQKADAFKKIAVSVLMIAGAIVLLGAVDSSILWQGLLAFVGILGVITAFMLAANFLPKGAKVFESIGKMMNGIGLALLGIGVSVGIIVWALGSMTKLIADNMDSETGELSPALQSAMSFITEMLVVVGGIAIVLTALSKSAGSGIGAYGAASTILAISFSLLIVIHAIKKTMELIAGADTEIKKNQLDAAKGLVAGIFIILGLTAWVLQRFGGLGISSLGSSVTIVALCLGLLAIVRAVGDIAELIKKYGGDVIEQAFWKIEGFLITFGGILVLVSALSKDAFGSLANALVFAAAGWAMGNIIDSFATAIVKISGVDPEIVKTFFEGAEVAFIAMGTAVAALIAIPVTSWLKAGVSLAAIALFLGIAGTIALNLVDHAGSVIWALGSKLKNFGELMEGVNIESMQTIIGGFTDVVFPFITDFAGKKGDFESAHNSAQELMYIGADLQLFGMSTALISKDNSKLTSLATDMAKFIDGINAINGVDEAKDVIMNVGGAVGLYYDNLTTPLDSEGNPIDTSNLSFDPSAANSAFSALAELSLDEDTIAKIKSYATGGEQDLNSFAIGVKNLGTALKSYGENLSSIKSKDIDKGNTIIDKVLDIQTSLNRVTWDDVLSPLKGRQEDLGDFSENIVLLGNALSNYGNSTSSLSLGKILLANSALSIISAINNDLTPIGGVVGFFTGNKNLGTFASNIAALGDGIAQFSNNIDNSALDNINVEKALLPITIISEAQARLEKTGGFASLITGSVNLGSLGEALVGFGKQMNVFVTDTEGIMALSGKETSVDYALGVLTKVIDLQERLHKEAGGNGYDVWAFESLGSSITNFVNDFNTLNQAGKEGILFWQKDTASPAQEANAFIDLVLNGIINPTVQAINDNAYLAVDAMANLLTEVFVVYDDYAPMFMAIGGFIDSGIAIGIQNGSDGPINAVAALMESVVEKAKEVGDIDSPSKEAEWIGQMFDEGLANGLLGYVNLVMQASDTVASGATSGIQAGLAGFQNAILEGLDDTPTIRPVLDLSDITSGASRISGLLGGQTVGASVTGLRLTKGISLGANSVSVNSAASSNADMKNAIDRLSERVDQLGNSIMNMKLVMDTGALVGQIAGPIDQALGDFAVESERRDR